jgi:hypothetical protein
VDIFDPCSTTRTLLFLSSLCERLLSVFKDVLLVTWAGGNNGNAAFGALFGNENWKAGSIEWADPLPASMYSNSTSEWWPASMSMSTRLFESMLRKNAMSLFCLLCPVIFIYLYDELLIVLDQTIVIFLSLVGNFCFKILKFKVDCLKIKRLRKPRIRRSLLLIVQTFKVNYFPEFMVRAAVLRIVCGLFVK